MSRRHLEPVDDAFIPAGKRIRIPFFFCPLCDDSGVVKDDNGEPVEFCDCRIGEDTAARNGGDCA
jgi:hypothetical protein